MQYSVYIGSDEKNADINETGHRISGKARVAGNKAIRAAVGEALTSKAASSSRPSTPQIKDETKSREPKIKKEKNEEEKKQAQFRTEVNKTLTSIE